MADAAFLVPGDLAAQTGGYAYARALLANLPDQGLAIRHIALPGGFPSPTADDIAETERLIASIPPDVPLLIDGLAYGAFPRALATAIPNPIAALVHHPLCLENGIDAAAADALKASERAALRHADHAIAASPTTARALRDLFQVPPDRISVALPGTEPAPRSTGSQSATTALLAVGTLTPRKGYDVLIDAAVALTDLNWHLTIVGDATRAPETVQALRQRIEVACLGDRVTMTGAIDHDALNAAYAGADVFVLASHYEGYGMVLAEALARGLPIVTTTGGAAAETVPDAAALKVPPADARALSDAVGTMIRDEAQRRACADAAWRAGQALPTWAETAARIARVLREVS
ncbi:MAG: glycosyltransferase family 4 protein [Pseudomonadota bacterium]